MKIPVDMGNDLRDNVSTLNERETKMIYGFLIILGLSIHTLTRKPDETLTRILSN